MVYFALTQQGFRKILSDTDEAKAHVWCGADVLSEEEFEQLGRGNVTRFSCSFANADKAALKDALSTIEEHHPGEVIWVEGIGFEH